MNIHAITTASNFGVKSNRNNAPVFKGLWGENTYESYSDSTYSVENCTLHYYPFKDESKEHIKQVVEDHSSSDYSLADYRKVPDPIACYSSTNVIVHDKLPFTTEDFDAYMNRTLYTLKKKVIEDYILEKNLRQ